MGRGLGGAVGGVAGNVVWHEGQKNRRAPPPGWDSRPSISSRLLVKAGFGWWARPDANSGKAHRRGLQNRDISLSYLQTPLVQPGPPS